MLAMLITHMPGTIPRAWNNLSDCLTAHFIEELWEESSRHPGYDYLALHLQKYNRFGEDVSSLVLYMSNN